MRKMVSSALYSSRCGHAADRIATGEQGSADDRGSALEGLAYGAGSEPRACAGGTGSTGARSADHAGAGRRPHDDLAHARGVSGGRLEACTGGCAATRQTASVPYGCGSAHHGAGLFSAAGGGETLDTAALGASGPSPSGYGRDQPRDHSPAAKKTASNLGGD